MSGYKYDDEGGQFFTFALTAVVAFLVPYTYRTLFSRAKSTAHGWLDRRGHKASAVQALMRPPVLHSAARGVVIVLGWALVAYLVRRIATAAQNSTHAVYDPFQILGIAASATEKEIRRRYRKLSVQFHPDKFVNAANQTKEEIDAHYIELTKAYKALTDEATRKNLELYGHPDGRQEMSLGIALPTWIVESQNNVWVLGAYGLVLAIALPLVVARWWYGTRSRTKDGVLNATALGFFTKLKKDMSAAEIFALLGHTEELTTYAAQLRPTDDAAYDALEKETCAVYERLHGTALLGRELPTPARRATVLLAAYLHRVASPNAHVEQGASHDSRSKVHDRALCRQAAHEPARDEHRAQAARAVDGDPRHDPVRGAGGACAGRHARRDPAAAAPYCAPRRGAPAQGAGREQGAAGPVEGARRGAPRGARR